MKVIDAEYQWFVSPPPHRGYLLILSTRDRRKLTFYFIAEKRIDFRELVRELFRFVSLCYIIYFFNAHISTSLYKTRIWMEMATLKGSSGSEQFGDLTS